MPGEVFDEEGPFDVLAHARKSLARRIAPAHRQRNSDRGKVRKAIQCPKAIRDGPSPELRGEDPCWWLTLWTAGRCSVNRWFRHRGR
jgi:hypothetical protein